VSECGNGVQVTVVPIGSTVRWGFLFPGRRMPGSPSGISLGLLAALAALAGRAEAQRESDSLVQVQMRRVDFHVDSTIVLHIVTLRGELLPGSHEEPPWFDDKLSFVLGIDSAEIGISASALGRLLNRYTFAYPGSPFSDLRISIEKGRLRQQGKLRGLPFSILGDLAVTGAGEIRLHPASIKVIGIPVGGLMKLFGVELDHLVHLRPERGVQVDKNDLLLSPSQLLPPPKVRARVAAVAIRDSEVVQVLHRERGEPHAPLRPPKSNVNYMFYCGGTLRFGKLTMTGADLEIVDADSDDPFDFFLAAYNDQLVAGYSRNTPDHGLITYMPDFDQTDSVLAAGGLEPGVPGRRRVTDRPAGCGRRPERREQTADHRETRSAPRP
jgi:hypothetical protein